MNVVQGDDQKDTAQGDDQTTPSGTQGLEVDAPVTTIPPLLSRFDRRHLVALSVGGLLLLAAIAAAVTMGVLYHQEVSTRTDSVAVFDEEELERFKQQEQELGELRTREEEHQRAAEQKAATELEDAKYWFNVRLGIHIGGIVLALAVFAAVLKLGATKPLLLLFFGNFIVALIMFSVDGSVGGGYAMAGVALTLILAGCVRSLKDFLDKFTKSGLIKALTHSTWFIVLAAASIMAIIIPIVLLIVNAPA